MNDIRAYQNIKNMVDACEVEWEVYNAPQKLYAALHLIDQLAKLSNPVMIQAANDYIAKFIPLHYLVQKYR